LPPKKADCPPAPPVNKKVVRTPSPSREALPVDPMHPKPIAGELKVKVPPAPPEVPVVPAPPTPPVQVSNEDPNVLVPPVPPVVPLLLLPLPPPPPPPPHNNTCKNFTPAGVVYVPEPEVYFVIVGALVAYVYGLTKPCDIIIP
jgi:hypothetical protein